MDNEFSLVKCLDIYDNDPDVLQDIIKDKEDYKKTNLATQAKFGETLIVYNNKLKALTNDVIEALGESEIEIQNKNIKINNLKLENEFLKDKLEDNNIVYEDGLKNLINNNTDSLIIKKHKDIKRKGLNKLLELARKNRNL